MSKDNLNGTNNLIPTGSRILVTGASGGIGEALVKLLCNFSCKIGFHSMRSAIPENLVRYAETNGTLLEKISGNFLNSSDSHDAIHRFCSLWGGIDALVQLHGDANSKQFYDLKDKDWDEALKINLISPFFLAQTAMKEMRNNSAGGRIVLTSTASAKHGGGINTIPYGTAKAGIECLVKMLAKIGAKDNILVNAVAPGFINTSFHSKRLGKNSEQIEKRKKLIPLGRAGTSEEVARSIVFLLSQSSTFITGETMTISGGDRL